jgi:hypothetical protein
MSEGIDDGDTDNDGVDVDDVPSRSKPSLLCGGGNCWRGGYGGCTPTTLPSVVDEDISLWWLSPPLYSMGGVPTTP